MAHEPERRPHVALVSRRIVREEGQGRVNAEIIKSGVGRGLRFTLVAEAVSPELLALPGVDWVRMTMVFPPTHLLRTLMFAVKTTSWLKRHRADVDIVHVDGFSTFAHSDVNVVHYIHTDWLRAGVVWAEGFKSARGFYQLLLTQINAWLERGAFRKTKVAVGVSEGVRDGLLRMGVPERSIRVITNGVDLTERVPNPLPRAQLDIPDDVFLLLFAGDLQTARKNLDTILRALVLVPGVHLAIAGEVRSARYPDLCKELGLSERVHFISFRNRDLPEVMAAADAFLMMSLYEPFGLVVLESMVSETAVVTAKSVGASGLVGEGGVVVDDPRDVQSLAKVIRQLSEEPERVVEMGKTGRKLALEHTWQRMATSYIDVYERMMMNEP